MKMFLWIAIGLSVAACQSSPPRFVIGTTGTNSRVELGKGASIQGPIIIRSDDGTPVSHFEGYMNGGT